MTKMKVCRTQRKETEGRPKNKKKEVGEGKTRKTRGNDEAAYLIRQRRFMWTSEPEAANGRRRRFSGNTFNPPPLLHFPSPLPPLFLAFLLTREKYCFTRYL